ncbi:UNVERIFIED_CONTAM: hypothetical protein HDU68_001008 [Siphonaria sp. JEL0065]|nr:hypothetical protein HDU68_001008 [Siphonaria sp. JEL0065]
MSGRSKLYDFDDEPTPAAATSDPNAPGSSVNGGSGSAKPVVPAGWAHTARLIAPVRRKAPVVEQRPKLPTTVKRPVQQQQQTQPHSQTQSILNQTAKLVSKIIKTPKDDDYDPNKPNEFEAAKRDAKRRRKEKRWEEKEKKRLNHSRGSLSSVVQTQPNIVQQLESQHEQENKREESTDVKTLTTEGSEDDDDDEDVDGIPLDTSLLQQRTSIPSAAHFQVEESGDDAYLRRMNLSAVAMPAPAAAAVVMQNSGEDAYQQRMRLSNQTGNKSPTIPHAQLQRQQQPQQPQQSQQNRTSRVVLLLNMVGPGEVDDDLKDETASECSKFGPVERVQIHESKGFSVRDDEAVRIYVKFRSLDSAVEGKTHKRTQTNLYHEMLSPLSHLFFILGYKCHQCINHLDP